MRPFYQHLAEYASEACCLGLFMAQAEAAYSGWLRRLLTHRVEGLHKYEEMFARLQNPDGAIKIFCEVAPL